MEPSQNYVMQANAAYYADEGIDNHLNVRIPVPAGPHVVGATFIKKNSALIETTRQPYDAHFNMDRHPRQQPAVRSVSIVGPFDPDRDRRDAQPRPDLLVAGRPTRPPTSTPKNARRRSSRGWPGARTGAPVTVDDLDQLVSFYQRGHAGGGVRGGHRDGAARAAREPRVPVPHRARIRPAWRPGAPYRVSDLELASRLSFFLWSSVPDDELIDVAAARRLSDPAVLRAQVRRMLADPRAETLTTNFASQWLHLRNLDAVRPDARLFPDFDDNLRQSFRRETELLFQSVLEEDRSVVDLLTADYTFVNERVARHYGFPGVYGDHFAARRPAGGQPPGPACSGTAASSR